MSVRTLAVRLGQNIFERRRKEAYSGSHCDSQATSVVCSFGEADQVHTTHVLVDAQRGGGVPLGKADQNVYN